MQKLIAPSILSADFSKLGEELSLLEQAKADWLHLDIMDGHFVPNLTFGPPVVRSLRKISNLFFDVHLMVDNPESMIDEFIDAGADAVTLHAETCLHLDRYVQKIKLAGKKAGVALNPATTNLSLEWVLDDLDFILIMSVNPGFGGQAFLPFALEKIRQLKEMTIKRHSQALIAVDGGINETNIREVGLAGADILVIGSALFKEDSYAEAIKKYRTLLA